MLSKQSLLELIQVKGLVKTSDIVKKYAVSRQYAHKIVGELVREGKVIKIGSTRSAVYTTKEYLHENPSVLPGSFSKVVQNDNLEEHLIYEDFKQSFPQLSNMPENIKSIFEYAFLEMFNNAIEHSQSEKIKFMVNLLDDQLSFEVDDYGIGVFRNIMNKKNIKSELNAIQDLLKGKMTTAPRLHSGEGIFFTSKVATMFMLDSYGYRLTVDNSIDDVVVEEVKGQKQGTRVTFSVAVKNKQHLNDVFKEYTDLSGEGDYGFDKTKIFVKLYTIGGVHISRSQARRVLSGLDKFQVVVMDYDQVPSVGQAFADEIYRVFKIKHPDIEMEDINMNETVKFMVSRARKEARTGS